MDAPPRLPLTRQELQEELQRFAQGELQKAFNAVLEREHIVPKVQESSFEDPIPEKKCARRESVRKSVRVKPGKRWSELDLGDEIDTTPKQSESVAHHGPPEGYSPTKPDHRILRMRTDTRWEERLDSREIHVTREFTGEQLLDGTDSHSDGCRSKIRQLVQTSRFEQCSGMIVILNAFALGYDTNYMALHPRAEASPIMAISEILFCILFSTELLLRILAHGCRFFTMDGYKWNIFDMVLVSVQIVEQALLYIGGAGSSHPDFAMLRLMRLLRVARIARLLRAFHLFDDLRVIMTSIGNSITSLGWSMVLLLLIIYIASLVFLQIILGAGKTKHHEQIKYWFASLFRAFLTMFECVVGGVSWDEVLAPIVEDISPILALLFCVYISMCLFAMMNLLTGVFVDKAMTSVREDKDVVLAKRIRDLFLSKQMTDGGHAEISDTITWEDFQEKIQTKTMLDYFAQINVEVSEAKSLFDLMDEDGSGSLDSHEIVRACLQLRGPARALELMMLMKDVRDLQMQVAEIGNALKRPRATRSA